MTYPWLSDHIKDLATRYQDGKLPHALLFAGQSGLGKYWLAETLAAQMLCEVNTGCGQCKGCLLLSAGSHPDIRLVSPEEGSQQIKIEQVRDLINWVNQTAQMNGAKIAIITPAHKMNRNSANALLKIMEEPPAGNHLILLSDDPAVLLPTIRSRAQQVLVTVPPFEDSVAWLEQSQGTDRDWRTLLALSNGAPLLALDRADDEYLERRQKIAGVWRDLFAKQVLVIKLAESVSKLDLGEVLELGIEMLADVTRVHATGDKNSCVNKDILDFTSDIVGCLDSREALRCLGRVEKDYRLAKGSQNPNQTLLLESLMADCQTPLSAQDQASLSL